MKPSKQSIFIILVVGLLSINIAEGVRMPKSFGGRADIDAIQTTWADAIAKAKAFVGQLNLDEKVGLATGVGWMNGPCVGNIPAISRLGFPGYCLQDSPTGVRFGAEVSAFSTGINTATTWNRSRFYERGFDQGSEFKGKGVNVALTPMMNLGRVAAGGRNWEGFGADPYLSGEAAAQTVIGLQDAGVIATAKHFILNEQEHYRTYSSSNIDDRTIHELYGWPFMQSVMAGVASIMCSYNLVNNVYACQNDHTLNQMLKNEWGFQGFVQSDWSATMSGVPSVLAGLDMTMPGDITFNSGTSYFGKNLSDAVNNGQVSQARLNDMAVRIIAPWYLLGQDSNYPTVDINSWDPNKNGKRNVQGNHAIKIRQLGAESNVLLKNVGGILPLSSKSGNFAVIGQDAGPSPGGPNQCADHGCNQGTLAQGWGSGTSQFPYLITPVQAIQAKVQSTGQKVTTSFSDSDLNTAKQLAQSADVAIVFGNADSGEGYITVEGNEGDRNDLNLWHNTNALIEAVASVQKNTVVVLHTVGPVLMPWIANPNIKAVLYAGVPGQESGNSLVDVLFGDVNPSGKLPYTIAKQAADYPASVIYNNNGNGPLQINYTEGLFIDYRWFDYMKIAPQFEFGFGLSYTNFTYSNLQISAAATLTSPIVTVGNDTILYKISATIANSGSVAGAEVAQLYLGFPSGYGEPLKVLRGFDKVFLQPKSSAVVVFYVSQLEVSTWVKYSNSWEVSKGQFEVYVGASSRDIKLTGSMIIG